MRYARPITISGFGKVGQQLAHLLLGRTPLLQVYSPRHTLMFAARIEDLAAAAAATACGTRVQPVLDVREIHRESIVIQAAKGPYDYRDLGDDVLRHAGLRLDCPRVRRFAEALEEAGFRGIYVNVTNPTNVLTRYAREFLDIPPANMLAFGSSLDSARFRLELSRKLLRCGHQVSPDGIDALVLGEHGPKMVFPRSLIRAMGQPISNYLSPEDLESIEERVRVVGNEIVTILGGTWLGPAAALMRSLDFLLSPDHPMVAEATVWQDHYVGIPVARSSSRMVPRLDLLRQQELHALEESLETVQRTFGMILQHYDDRRERVDVLLLAGAVDRARKFGERLADACRNDPSFSERYWLHLDHGTPTAFLDRMAPVPARWQVCEDDRPAAGIPFSAQPDVVVLLEDAARLVLEPRFLNRLRGRLHRALVVALAPGPVVRDIGASREREQRALHRLHLVDAVVDQGEHAVVDLPRVLLDLLEPPPGTAVAPPG